MTSFREAEGLRSSPTGFLETVAKANENRTDANAITPANLEKNVACQREDPKYHAVAQALLVSVLKTQLPSSKQGASSGVPAPDKRPAKKARLDSQGKEVGGVYFSSLGCYWSTNFTLCSQTTTKST